MTPRIEAFANPNVLLWARRMSGLEGEEAARKAGVKLERLDSWEKGELRPTITQLRSLADIYKRPLAVFFLDSPPPDEAQPKDFRRFDPRAAEPLTPALRLAVRDARSRRGAALELFDDLTESPPEFGFRARLNEDPEKVGERLREKLTKGKAPPRGDTRLSFNFWRMAAENAGVLVFQAEDVDMEEMRGFSIAERPLPAVVLNIKDAYAGRTFSLLHEVTHVALNRGGLCLLEEHGPQTEVRGTEVFCNHVAGAAMLPARLLLAEPETPRERAADIPDDVIEALAGRYGTSEEAVLRRLVLLNRVSAAFYQRKRAQYQTQYGRLRQQRRTGGFAPPHALAVARGGRAFTRLVLEAYDDDRITASDVSEYLGVRLKHLDRIREAVREKAIGGGAR